MALRPERPQNRSEQLAQRKAAEQDVLMREVDDALRQDEMLGAFQRFGKPVAIGVVLGLVALGGWLWWDNSQRASVGAHGEQLTMALDKVEAGRLAEGDKELAALAGESKDGIQAAAKLMRGVADRNGTGTGWWETTQPVHLRRYSMIVTERLTLARLIPGQISQGNLPWIGGV